MADIRIKDLAVTASSSASDDYLAVDGSTNGTRKLSAYSPTFGGNLTVSGGSIVNGSSTSVLYFGTPSNNYLYYDGSSLFCRVGGSDRFTIPSGTGNLLIGTTTDASQKLAVKGSASAPSLTANATAIASFTPSSVGTRLVVGGDSSSPFCVWMQNRHSDIDGLSYPIAINPSGGNVLIGTTTDGGQKLQVAGTAAISGAISIGNTVQTAVSVASTHKVTISIGGTTYYLLATNV